MWRNISREGHRLSREIKDGFEAGLVPYYLDYYKISVYL